ncbi:hypothetical protein PV08_11676 [Exophiala spinifera]|uniref:Tat pathway signal sequence n=1 Tax=Exophiala spinifera TaxID=91928 RepID=A0A0D2ATR5_9EURO|nr:uncharacterized protein PV08_11676 [Exophiala spinifera]KIW09900.1 hypothetical protein PV08_11676 [Exophiala spinifera]
MKLFSKNIASGEVEDHESLLQNSELQGYLQDPNSPKFTLSLGQVLIGTFLILTLFSGGLLAGLGFAWNRNADCTTQVTQGSPLLEDISLSYKTIRFNGTFLDENIYRQSASPEVDAAWQALGSNYRSVAIPEDRASEAGLRRDQVRINPKYGGGYPANVEGLHQLHCLNLLRQALYYNFDYYHALKQGAFKNDDNILKKHVSHCLDILRQQLMCTVDIGVLGQVWYNPSSPAPFVDFNTMHKCRNFEDVRKWAEARQLPKDVPPDFLQPPADISHILPGVP